MARANYERCLAETLSHEGGWANHPRDPGGATMRGVIQRNYDRYRDQKRLPRRSVRQIEDHELREIYRDWFWEPVWGDELPFGLDLVAFDGGVNSGPPRGVRWLQKGVGSAADGKMGPNTLAASRRAKVTAIERACAARMSFLRALSHWDAFGRGWSRRVASVEATATRMFLEASNRDPVSTREALRGSSDAASARSGREIAAGGTQATGTGAAGAGGAAAVDPSGAQLYVLVGVIAVAVLLIVMRSQRRAKHQKDRARAFKREAENASKA